MTRALCRSAIQVRRKANAADSENRLNFHIHFSKYFVKRLELFSMFLLCFRRAVFHVKFCYFKSSQK